MHANSHNINVSQPRLPPTKGRAVLWCHPNVLHVEQEALELITNEMQLLQDGWVEDFWDFLFSENLWETSPNYTSWYNFGIPPPKMYRQVASCLLLQPATLLTCSHFKMESFNSFTNASPIWKSDSFASVAVHQDSLHVFRNSVAKCCSRCDLQCYSLERKYHETFSRFTNICSPFFLNTWRNIPLLNCNPNLKVNHLDTLLGLESTFLLENIHSRVWRQCFSCKTIF